MGRSFSKCAERRDYRFDSRFRELNSIDVQRGAAMVLRPLMLAVFFALASATGAPAAAKANVDIVVNVAPPPLRVEAEPPPRVGYVWAPGHWEWRHGHHVWVRGHWIRARQGLDFEPAHWIERDGRWVYVPAHWVRL
jgi:hypothetical protein